jgi:hypothetical protein
MLSGQCGKLARKSLRASASVAGEYCKTLSAIRAASVAKEAGRGITLKA